MPQAVGYSSVLRSGQPIVQGSFVPPIPDDIPLELVLPETHARLGARGPLAAGVPVPETPVDHDDGPVLRKHKIG